MSVCVGLAGSSSSAQTHELSARTPGKAQAEPVLASTLGSKAPDSEISAFFDKFFVDAMRRHGVPGGALIVVREGRPILAKSYGYADLSSRRPVDLERTLFRQASVSKVLVWLTIIQLVEEGRIDLDRDLNAYLDFRIPDAFGRPITMRHLMTHSAGFADRMWGVLEPDTRTPLWRLVRENVPERVHPPGKVISYSNYGAALAAHVVERVTGRRFEQVVAERVFDPIGMTRSTFAQPVPHSLRPLLASTYPPGRWTPAKFQTAAAAPAGALTASAGDMGRLLIPLLNGGQGLRGQVARSASLKLMLSVQQPLVAGTQHGFGLGLLTGDYNGVRYAGHGGSITRRQRRLGSAAGSCTRLVLRLQLRRSGRQGTRGSAGAVGRRYRTVLRPGDPSAPLTATIVRSRRGGGVYHDAPRPFRLPHHARLVGINDGHR